MQENICLQCREKSSPPLNRLVQDACGHQKCRRCLLQDELGCQQCKSLNGTSELLENNVDGNSVPFENHTAVIQCNGIPKVALDMVNSSTDNGYIVTGSSHNNLGQNMPIKEEPREILSTKMEDKMLHFNETPIKQNTSQPVGKVLHFNEDFKTPFEHKDLKKESAVHAKSKSVKDIKKQDLPDHISVNLEPLYFLCNLCNKSFKTRGHVKYHTFCTGEDRPHKCPICTKDFILKAQLELHLIKHRKEKPLGCNICEKSFYEASKLKRHLLLHSEEKKHLCTACGKTYRTKEALQIHFSIHKGEKLFGCRLCPAKFNNSSNLKRHSVTHSGKKLHMCDLCGKKFKLKWALKVHKKSHTRMRDFQCETCFKTFVLNKELQRHILTHDNSTTYSCSACSTSFRRKDNLYRHIKNTHPNKNDVNVIVEKQDNTDQTEEKSTTQPKTKPTRRTIPKPTRVKNRAESIVMDNPNAIKVITASPAFVGKSKTHHLSNVAAPRDLSKCVKLLDSRGVIAGSQAYNGPPKLAFKGPAFKMHYNIKRGSDYVSPAQVPQPINLSESVDICQKIMSPSTDYTCPITDEITSSEICQKILCIPDENLPKSVDAVVIHQPSDCSYEFEHRIKTESEMAHLAVDTYQDINQRGLSTSPTREILGIQAPVPINLSESVNIYQKIMSPSTDYRDPTKTVDERTFKETCQRILSISPGLLLDPVPVNPDITVNPVPINLSESVDMCQRIMSPSTDYRDPTKTVDETNIKEICQTILSSSPPPVPINLSESVDICQRIMSPSTDYRDPTKTVDERSFKETCQKILSISDEVVDKTIPLPSGTSIQEVPSPQFSSYSSPVSDYSQYSSPSPRPGLPQYSNTLHYASSFQNQKHAVIKSIKFKVPQEYTKIFKQQQERLGSREDSNKNSSSSAETASVIVNNSSSTKSH